LRENNHVVRRPGVILRGGLKGKREEAMKAAILVIGITFLLSVHHCGASGNLVGSIES
jgi:hypothetical protein